MTGFRKIASNQLQRMDGGSHDGSIIDETRNN